MQNLRYQSRPSELDRTKAKIRSFAELPAGWRFGEGGPINRTTIDRALAWADWLGAIGADEFEVFPGVGGEVQVCGYIGGLTIEVTQGAEAVDAVVERDGEVILERFAGAPGEVRRELVGAVGGEWAGFVYFIHENIALRSAASPAWHSEIPPAAEYPSSTANALSAPADRYVRTSRDTIPQIRVLRQRFGVSIQQSFLKAVASSNKTRRQGMHVITT